MNDFRCLVRTESPEPTCRHPRTFAAAWAIALALTGCGGGDPVAGAASPEQASETGGHSHALASTASAAGYYVDADRGNDTNPGTIDQPFKSLGRLLTLRLSTGQGIYLHCGGVWREPLNLGATQLVDGSVIASYGDNCTAPAAPRITGADNFSGGWTLRANGVWSRSVPAETPKITRLFINGNPLRTAQWPNDDGTGTTQALTDKSTTANNTAFVVSAADAATLAGRSLAGATALNRTSPWMIESHAVGQFDASTRLITLTASTVNALGPSQGYVLQDKLWMLDAENEFFHDTDNNLLYLKPSAEVASAGLNNQRVEGAVRDNAITLGGRSGLQLSGLVADMSRVDGVVINDAPNAQITALRAYHHTRAGLRIFSSSPVTGTNRNATVSNGIFRDNAVMGIDATRANRVTLSHVSVQDTGTMAWAGNAIAGVWVGDGGIVDGSAVQRSAYVGIRFSGTDQSSVTNNDVTGYCLRLADCAGIYTWNGPKGSAHVDNQSSIVSNNRVGSASVSPTGAAVAGIYLDDYSRGVQVKDNSVAGVPYGIIIHNGSNNLVTGNKVWLNTFSSLYMSMDQADADYMTGNMIQGNEFAPVSVAGGSFPALPRFTIGYGITYLTTQNLSTLTAGSNAFSGNTYLRLQEGSAPIAQARTSAGTTTYSAGAWRRVMPADGTVASPARFALLDTVLGPELQAGGGFDSGLGAWTAWFKPPGVGSLSAVDSHAGCNGPCALFASSSADDNFYGPAFDVTAGAMYVTRHSAGFDADATILPPYMTASASPNPSIVGSDGLSFIHALTGGPGDAFDTATYFHASASVSARVNLKVRTPSTPVAFDDVSVRQVQGYAPVPASQWAATVQPLLTDTTKTVTCETLGWPSNCSVMDAETGQAVTLPLTVPIDRPALLLRADTPLRRY